MKLFCLILQGSRDSLAVIVNRPAGRPWQLRNRGSVALLSDASRPSAGPIYTVGIGGSSPGTRAHEADHSSPYGSKVRNEWNCSSILSNGKMTCTKVLQSQAMQPGFTTQFELCSLLCIQTWYEWLFVC
jgi:hypothetical protein